MKQVNHLTEHIAPELHVAPQRSHRVSPIKNKRSHKGISKNVSFLEPEFENGSKKSSKKIKKGRYRNPLVPSNLDNENSVSKVSFVRKFKKSNTTSANNLEPCYASILHPAIAVITKTNVELAGANESLNTADSNGVNSNVDSPKPNGQIPPTDSETMVNFSDDSEKLSGHQRSTTAKLQKHVTGLDNNIFGTKSELSIGSPSLSGFNCLSKTNINFCNVNNLTNLTERSSDAVKSSDVIREEIRLRRSLFFGTDLGSEVLSNNYRAAENEDNINMNGYSKSNHFGFRQTTERKFVSSSSQGLARFETNVSPSKSSGISRSQEMNLPKLYSVHNLQHQPSGHGLNSSQSVTHVTQSQASKLPTFASGSNIRSNASSTASIKNSNTNQRNLYSRMPVQSLRSVKHVEPTENDASGQWISGSEFFKPRPTSNDAKAAAEVRRETIPAKFGNGYNSGFSGYGTHGKKSSPESHTSSEIRRGSVYSALGSRLPTYSGVKKPVESVPFYMMNLYKHSSNPSTISAVALESKHSLPVSQGSAGFSGVTTGVVKQRAIQYQSKIAEQSTSQGSPPSPLVRSSTYVKSTSPLAPDSNTPVIDPVYRVSDSPKSARNEDNNGKSNTMSTRKSLPMTGIPSPRTPRLSYNSSDNKENCQNLSPKGQHRNLAKTNKKPLSRPSQETMPTNFPLARDGSTTSSIVSTVSSEEHSSCGSGYATAEADKAISDSEFLIDDEISDQPDLTLTFKDSSLILSPSSSGESLISCDLMLDYKDSSCSGLVPGDSVLLVDEPCLSSTKESGRKSSVVRTETTNSSGVPQINMVNTTSANSGRRSQGSLQGLNGPISPISSSTPYSTHKLAKAPNLTGRGGQNQQNSSNRHILNQQNQASVTGMNFQRHGKYSGVPIPTTNSTSSNDISVLENWNSADNVQLSGSPGNTKLRAFNSRSPQRQSIGTPKSTSTRVPSPIVSSPKSVKHRRNEVTINHQTKESQENLEQPASPDPVPDIFIKEIITEVVEYKNKLKELLTVLESNEKDMSDKDDVIRKQQQEIEFWKSRYTEAVKKTYEDTDEDSIISRTYEADSWQKEKQVTLRKDVVNSAVQTESNYPSRAAVTYPEEHDKMGQLVSFRIGRRTSASNKS